MNNLVARIRWWIRHTFCRHDWSEFRFSWGSFIECAKCGGRK